MYLSGAMIGVELMMAAIRPILPVPLQVLIGFCAVAVGATMPSCAGCPVAATTLLTASVILVSALHYKFYYHGEIKDEALGTNIIN